MMQEIFPVRQVGSCCCCYCRSFGGSSMLPHRHVGVVVRRQSCLISLSSS